MSENKFEYYIQKKENYEAHYQVGMSRMWISIKQKTKNFFGIEKLKEVYAFSSKIRIENFNDYSMDDKSEYLKESLEKYLKSIKSPPPSSSGT